MTEATAIQLISLISLATILAFISLRYTSAGVSIISSGAWIGVWAFIQANPLTNIVAGGNTDVIIMLVLWGIALMLPTVVISRMRSGATWGKNSESVKGRLFSAPPPESGNFSSQRGSSPETAEEHRERMQRAFDRGRIGARRK